MQEMYLPEKFEQWSALYHTNLYINKCSFKIAYTYLKLMVEYVPGGV